ncbi:MAG: DNA-binding transcriptional LysR family regulator [Halioglobus sp.]|jgi:DNA-binding transcriptional LysR family regulator
MDWDDMRVLLALARKGSARGAAKELNVSNSTVTRRLDEMERSLKTQLFDRTPDGYKMTASAEDMLPTAEHVEELIHAAERKVSGGDQQLEGNIRLTLPEVGGMGFLMRRLAAFSELYPKIEIEFLPSTDTLDLSRREADIAIRVMPANVSPPDHLIGRKMSPISASTYVHRGLLNFDNPEDISHLNWIGKRPFDQEEDWLADSAFPNQPIRHSIDSLSLLTEALRHRMGMALIPCFAMYQEPDIVQVPGAFAYHHSDMWVLTHKDLRLSARLRVLRAVIAEEFTNIRHQLDSRSIS